MMQVERKQREDGKCEERRGGVRIKMGRGRRREGGGGGGKM